MNQKTNLKLFILSAALALGGAAAASAQSANVAVPTPTAAEPALGLLGARYSEALYRYYDLTGNGGPNHAHGLGIDFNQPLNANFDLNAEYDWARSRFAGATFTQQDVMVSTTAYSRLEWGRPFATVGAGWDWQRGGGARADSFMYKLGVGTEFQVTNAFVVTPYINFVRSTHYPSSEGDFGVKVAYRLTREWSLTASAQYDAVSHAHDQAEYTAGVLFRF